MTRIAGLCNQCGECCGRVGISTGYMRPKDSAYCQYLRWEGGLAWCKFKEGLRKPDRAYQFYLKYCVPFPRDISDLFSVKDTCSYEVKEDG